MNREMRRLMEREERRQKKQDASGGKTRRAPVASSRPQAEKKPLWERIRTYFHEVRLELRKVSWPTRDQMVAFTTVTLITTVALTAVVFGFDVLMKEIVLFVVERS